MDEITKESKRVSERGEVHLCVQDERVSRVGLVEFVIWLSQCPREMIIAW